MRELTQHTARVMDDINSFGQFGVITKHGRFVALITPLANAQVERLVVSNSLAPELAERVAVAEVPGAKLYSSDELAGLMREQHLG